MAIGLLERFHITRHFLGFDSCVLCAAQYVTPEHKMLDKLLLFSALRKVIQLHAALGVCVIGESSQVQSFVHLEAIDLAQVVEFPDIDDLKATFEDQLQRPFNTAAGLPLWRVIVLKNNVVCFAWHHCIGDGLSGLVFHRALISALQEATVTDDSAEVHLPSTTQLYPPLDTVMNISPSWRTFLRVMYELFAPTSWTRSGSAWTGHAVAVDTILKTHVRLIHFPPQVVGTFLALCRSNNATLTGALHTLAVSVLSGILSSTQNVTQQTISCHIPISLREVADIPQDVFCDCTSALNFYASFQHDFSWTEASKITAILRSRSKPEEEVGMLKYLYGNYVAYFEGKLGKKRQGGLELSNLGLFKGGQSMPPGCEEWSIGQMAFAQCDSVVGSALKINVIGNTVGGLTITVTWGAGSVEELVAESFVAGLERGFMELLMRCVIIIQRVQRVLHLLVLCR